MPSKYSLGTDSTKEFEFPLPSGNVCLMKHADLPSLISAGIVDSIDTLTAMVQTDHVDRVKKGRKAKHLPSQPQTASGALSNMDPQAMQVLEIMKDKKRWGAFERLCNAVVVECVVEPVVLRVPDFEQNGAGVPEAYVRPPAGDGKLYVDKVNLTDRLAIFAEAMRHIMAGQAAMKPFRGEGDESVAGMADGVEVQLPAERTAEDT